MEFLGIPLRKPTFNELTAAVIMAVGLWVAGVGLWKASGRLIEPAEAGAALLVLVWACSAARWGVRLDQGGRHLALHLGINAVLLFGYQAAWALVA